jgi:HSP20 family protein
MSIMRYQSLNPLVQLQQDINRLFNMNSATDDDSSIVYARDWAPAVDIREDADRYVVLADVPGVNPEDIEITMENSVLTIAGERRADSDEQASGFRRIERVRGRFLRRFTLPQSADGDKITARSAHGTLEVVIPKREQALSRRIPVSVASE